MSVVTKEPIKSTKRKTRAEYIAEIDELLEKMKAMDAKSDQRRLEIDRLAAESARLQAENEEVLARLKAMF